MTELGFHQQRKIFAIINNELIWYSEPSSHYDWLVGSGKVTEEEFITIVRGYKDDTGVYFYQGNFETNDTVESEAKKWIDSFEKDLPVYCGVLKGEIGERWKPITQIRGNQHIMLHDKCNVDVVSETIRHIDLYRSQKDNSIYDHFYHSNLDCMEELLIDWKKQLNDCYVVIACREGHIYDSGETSPTYATVCMKPHWDSEGIMFTSGLYDATKFDLDSSDIIPIFKYIQNRYKDKLLELVVLPKIIFGSLPRECWSSEQVRGDFDKTGEISGSFVKEISYEN